MIFVGNDWAQDHHDVWIMDRDGDKLASRRLPEGDGGLARLHELVAGFVDDPGKPDDALPGRAYAGHAETGIIDIFLERSRRLACCHPLER